MEKGWIGCGATIDTTIEDQERQRPNCKIHRLTPSVFPADRHDGHDAAFDIARAQKGDVIPAAEKFLRNPAAIDWHLFLHHQCQK
jgi:hypothetical protein